MASGIVGIGNVSGISTAINAHHEESASFKDCILTVDNELQGAIGRRPIDNSHKHSRKFINLRKLRISCISIGPSLASCSQLPHFISQYAFWRVYGALIYPI